jgi:hypothetical protein
MVNFDYCGPNYVAPRATSWDDYANPLECLRKVVTIDGSILGLPLYYFYFRYKDVKKYLDNSAVPTGYYKDPSQAPTLQIEDVVREMTVFQARDDVKYLLKGSADYGFDKGVNRYHLGLGMGNYALGMGATAENEIKAHEFWAQLVNQLATNDDPRFANLIGLRIPYYDRGISTDENGNVIVPVVDPNKYGGDPNYNATIHANLIGKQYVSFIELQEVNGQRVWAQYPAVVVDKDNTLKYSALYHAPDQSGSVVETTVKPNVESYWAYVKALPTAAVIDNLRQLSENIKSWYQYRDEHAQAHPENEKTGWSDIAACAKSANIRSLAGDPTWWSMDSVAIKPFRGLGLFENRVGYYHPDIRYWDTTYANSFEAMFKNSSFNGVVSTWDRVLPDIAEFGARPVSMKDMFRGNKYFNNGQPLFVLENGANDDSLISPLPTPNRPLTWNKVGSGMITMSGMFAGTDSVVTYFNQDISSFDTTSVKDMSEMFFKNVNFNQNLTTRKKVKSYISRKIGDDNDVTYKKDTVLITDYEANRWDVVNVDTMAKMFNGATSFDNGVPVLVNGVETKESLKLRNDIANWNVGSSTVLDYTSMFELASSFDRMIIRWNVACSKNPKLEDMVKGSGLSLVDQFDQGFKGVSTPPCSLFNKVRCFNEGTKILCRKNGKEQYISVEDLREGDKVYTENHGYKKIADMRKATVVLNRLADMGLYRMKKQGNMIADLEMTGLHAILIDKDDAKYADDIKRQGGLNKDKYFVDDKFRLRANECHEFKQMERKEYTIYSFSLQTPQQQYGIYANGLLVETTSRRILRVSDMEKVSSKKEETI